MKRPNCRSFTFAASGGTSLIAAFSGRLTKKEPMAVGHRLKPLHKTSVSPGE
jgi:hypothetical protein